MADEDAAPPELDRTISVQAKLASMIGEHAERPPAEPPRRQRRTPRLGGIAAEAPATPLDPELAGAIADAVDEVIGQRLPGLISSAVQDAVQQALPEPADPPTADMASIDQAEGVPIAELVDAAIERALPGVVSTAIAAALEEVANALPPDAATDKADWRWLLRKALPNPPEPNQPTNS